MNGSPVALHCSGPKEAVQSRALIASALCIRGQEKRNEKCRPSNHDQRVIPIRRVFCFHICVLDVVQCSMCAQHCSSGTARPTRSICNRNVIAPLPEAVWFG